MLGRVLQHACPGFLQVQGSQLLLQCKAPASLWPSVQQLAVAQRLSQNANYSAMPGNAEHHPSELPHHDQEHKRLREIIEQQRRLIVIMTERQPDCLDETADYPRSKTPAQTMALNKRVGFLGAGQMAEALARGLVAKGVVTANKMCCSDPNQSRMDLFSSIGITAYSSNVEVARNSDVLFVAVKPQYVSVVLREAQPVLTPQHTIVSIAAGVTVEQLVSAAGPEARVVRVMPNTPCLVGETAAAMCLGGKADASDEHTVRQMFEAVGKIFTVDEKLLAAVTGLSGSGPAYVFVMIEALADGGVRAGLPREIALSLAAQTVLGSARMVLDTGKHPGALKDMVTSPGGTTIAGVHELEKAGVRAALMNAVVAATNRANELSKL